MIFLRDAAQFVIRRCNTVEHRLASRIVRFLIHWQYNVYISRAFHQLAQNGIFLWCKIIKLIHPYFGITKQIGVIQTL